MSYSIMTNPVTSVSLAIIDDNAGSLEMLSTALRRPEVRIRTFADPEEGLDYILQEHPQIVLTDLVMPKMNGMELLAELRSRWVLPKVIVMSADGAPQTVLTAVKEQNTSVGAIVKQVNYEYERLQFYLVVFLALILSTVAFIPEM